jgi:hypothetical protein
VRLGLAGCTCMVAVGQDFRLSRGKRRVEGSQV